MAQQHFYQGQFGQQPQQHFYGDVRQPVESTKSQQSQPQPESQPKENDDKKKKSRDRWNFDQTKCIVSLWCEKQTILNSTRCNQAWTEIKNEIDKIGSSKSVEQCKNKIKALKDQYKKAKQNNKKSGEEPKFPPFYEEFDKILSERSIFTMPEFKEVGQRKEAVVDSLHFEDEQNELIRNDEPSLDASIDENYLESVNGDDLDVGPRDIPVPKKRVKRKQGNDDPNLRKKKKTIQEEFLDVQKKQLDFFKESEEKHMQFMQNMVQNQMENDALERERDRKFFLELGKVFKEK